MMRLSCALLRSFGRHHVASPRLPSSAAALLKISFAPRGLVTVAARASPSRSAASVPQSLSARIISCGLKTYRNKPSPKPIKTKSCVKKRIRVSGKGLIKFKRAGMRHNLGCKSPEKRARLNRKGVLRGVWAKKMKKLLLI